MPLEKSSLKGREILGLGVAVGKGVLVGSDVFVGVGEFSPVGVEFEKDVAGGVKDIACGAFEGSGVTLGRPESMS